MLKVHTKRLDAIEALCLEGQIINGDTETLRSAVQAASDAGDIILDLQNVGVVDAHGLGVLLQLREQALAKGIRFKLINVSKPLYKIFEITRLNTVFEIKPDVQFFPQLTYSQRLSVAA
jgi:Anti-anti-sigma regulatory factor (antagonist of anti-sigma factor)